MTQPARLGAWAKLSATYYRDDAVLRAGEAAELLFVRSLAFCAEAGADGYITDLQVTHVVGAGMRGLKARVEVLVAQGLWQRLDGGYLVRAWLKWNKSAEEIGMTKRKDRERKAGLRLAPIPADSTRNPIGDPADSLSETGQDTDRTGEEASTSQVMSSTVRTAWDVA